MDRFVAMIWDQEDPTRQLQVNSWSETLQRQSSKWKRVLDRPGLRVFSYHHRGDGPVVTHWQGEDGIVIGVLFERGQEKKGRVLSFALHEAERVVSTRGDSLIKNYWGNYVALWRCAKARETTVLRDPCGAVPCFMTRHNRIELLFSHADDVARLPGVRFDVDWNCIQAFILFNYFITKYTGLAQVTELLAGERLEWTPRGDSRFSWAWNGAEVAAEPNFQSFDDAKTELRATAEACFTAWGSEYRKIVVSLSGGLDSSILVNLLRRSSDAEVIGLHYLGVGYEQYEVKLARLAAAQAGVELIEAVQDPARDEVRRILEAPRLARPKVQSLAVLIDDISSQLADRVGADAFMIGQGGDNLFLQRSGAQHTLTDYVRLRGLGKDLRRVAYDAAMLQQQPIWKAMGDAFEKTLLNPPWRAFEFLENEEWSKYRPMTPDAIRAIPEAYKNHPWLANAARLSRGKADHLYAIAGLYNYYIHHGRGIARDVSYPYFSQPITEFALRTPTYVLAQDGLDRALQRSAFADLIPPEIARRTGKGRASAYLLQVMQQNIDFYRELILGGELIQQGWLDRRKIEHMLKPDFVVHGGGALFVYLLIATEVWISSWRDGSARAAA